MATAIDAKGDLIGGTGADTFARLAVGADGTVLTADSAETTGLKWATPAGGGGMTLLSTTTLSGASTTISVGSGYVNLYVLVAGMTANTGNGDFRLAINGSTNQTVWSGTWTNNGTSSLVGANVGYLLLNASNWTLRTNANNSWGITIADYDSSTVMKPLEVYGTYIEDGGGNVALGINGGFRSTSAVTSLVFSYTGGNFSAGTVKVYGVK
jgi:hypothetical protein